MWMLAVGLAGLGSAAFAWPVARGARAVPFAAGLLVTGLSAGAAAIAETLAPHAVVVDVPLAVEIPLVGLFLAVGAYLLGLLTPGERRGAEARPLVRLRTWLEGASFAICTLYTVWLLVIGPAGMRGASVTASLLGSLALGPAAASATRMLWPAAGVMLSIAGLTALSLPLGHRRPPVVTAGAALALLAAGPLIRYGSRAPGYPLLALPLVGSALATGYQLIHHRSLDTVAVGLAVATIVTVATREWLATTALRRYADHLAAQGEQLRALVLGAGEMALILDGRLMVRWQSPAAARQFGLSDQDVVGQPVTALVHPDDAGRCAAYLADPGEPCELRLRDGFGAYRETEWRCGGPDPARPGWSLVVHVRDVSQRRELERTLRRARYADRLTGLANRQGLRRAGEPRSRSRALMWVYPYGPTA